MALGILLGDRVRSNRAPVIFSPISKLAMLSAVRQIKAIHTFCRLCRISDKVVMPSIHIHTGVRTVDVHISRLRKALKVASPGSVIRTIRSAGYSLEQPDG